MKNKTEHYLSKEFNLTLLDRLNDSIKNFSLTEKIVFFILSIFLILSISTILIKINKALLVEVPKEGGTIYEGIIGTPRFINPLLAISDADRDLTTLIYSGLMRTTVNNSLVINLAESYNISPDGRVYTFVIKDNAIFHDGNPVTADDVIFTINKAQNPAIKSPRRATWEGVSVSKSGDKTVIFNLGQPYSPFLENLTMGILPKHIWENIDPETFAFSEYNIEPIGSGPFEFKNVKKDSSGLPVYYKLKAFEDYTLGKPWITTLYAYFYNNEDDLLDAYKKGEVRNVSGISPERATDIEEVGNKVKTLNLTRIFGVFFNQNQAPIFSNIEIRKALNVSVNRKEIVDSVLRGYGKAIDSPIPPGSLTAKYSTQSNINPEGDIEEATDILERNGWKKGDDGIFEKKSQKLEFSITTSDAPDLRKTAEILKKQWGELGAKVDVKIFSIGELNQSIIRPRKYDALLFGEVIDRNLDLFAFWHSSQRNDPGLNIALYTNITADKLLEKARSITNRNERLEIYAELEENIREDIPTVFLYSPDFIYIINKTIKNISLEQITTSSERFTKVHEWFIETERVWSFFIK